MKNGRDADQVVIRDREGAVRDAAHDLDGRFVRADDIVESPHQRSVGGLSAGFERYPGRLERLQDRGSDPRAVALVAFAPIAALASHSTHVVSGGPAAPLTSTASAAPALVPPVPPAPLALSPVNVATSSRLVSGWVPSAWPVASVEAIRAEKKSARGSGDRGPGSSGVGGSTGPGQLRVLRVAQSRISCEKDSPRADQPSAECPMSSTVSILFMLLSSASGQSLSLLSTLPGMGSLADEDTLLSEMQSSRMVAAALVSTAISLSDAGAPGNSMIFSTFVIGYRCTGPLGPSIAHSWGDLCNSVPWSACNCRMLSGMGSAGRCWGEKESERGRWLPFLAC